jgi:cell wall assembly regulator SMI1
MSELTDALNRIFAWWEKHKPADATRFNSGLTEEEVQAKLNQFPRLLPSEIYDLYKWHNGTNDDGWECGIFVYHSFMDVDYALKEADEYVRFD